MTMLSHEHIRVPMRLVGGYEAAIELPPHMADAAWQHMLRYLEVMRNAYAVDDEPLPEFAPTEPPTQALSDDV